MSLSEKIRGCAAAYPPYRTETNMPHYTYQHTQQESEFTYILCGFYVPQLIQ
jgi:hypothetical protein